MNTVLRVYGNCVINLWAAAPTAEVLQESEETCRKVAADHEDSVTYMAVLIENSPLLNAEQRKLIEGFYLRMGPYLSGVAQVVEGGNLWAVTARSVMTAMRLVQRRAYPLRVFADVDESVQWLADFVIPPEGVSGPDVVKGLSETIAEARAGSMASTG